MFYNFATIRSEIRKGNRLAKENDAFIKVVRRGYMHESFQMDFGKFVKCLFRTGSILNNDDKYWGAEIFGIQSR